MIIECSRESLVSPVCTSKRTHAVHTSDALCIINPTMLISSNLVSVSVRVHRVNRIESTARDSPFIDGARWPSDSALAPSTLPLFPGLVSCLFVRRGFWFSRCFDGKNERCTGRIILAALIGRGLFVLAEFMLSFRLAIFNFIGIIYGTDTLLALIGDRIRLQFDFPNIPRDCILSYEIVNALNF